MNQTEMSEQCTTEAVREAYQSSDDGLDFKSRFRARGAAFDEWLESVKSEAQSEARKGSAETVAQTSVHEQQYPGWSRDADGVWRNPRYPRGKPSQKDGLSLVYDPEINGGVLTIDGHSSPLSFGQVQHLIGQLDDVRRQAQNENSRLWKEKEQIMFTEEGIEPAVYVRGVRQSPLRRK